MLEINLRLQRLETYLIPKMTDTLQSHERPTTVSARCSSSNDNEQRQSIKTWDKLEAIAATPGFYDSEIEAQLSESSASQDDALNALGDPSKQILTPHNIPNAETPCSKCGEETKKTAELIQKLPGIQLAWMLFDYYARMVNNFHHEIDISFSRSLLETTYTKLHHPEKNSKKDLDFLFCIFSSSCFYIIRNNPNSLPRELMEARSSYNSWKEIALDLVLIGDAMLSLSLILLQSVCIMFGLIWDSEGQSPVFILLRSVATTKAIQMKLHRVDSHSDTELGARSTIELDIKRRLWWHLASTDWIVGSLPGPYEGIYAINPQHISVEYPTDVDSENAKDLDSRIEESNSPTSMSFFIQRAKFAGICREVMDLTQNSRFMRNVPEYEHILQLSEKFESFNTQLPWFFQFDAGKGREADLLTDRYPYIARQRSALLYALYARLGRLHRPYFLRGLHNEEYSFSRKTAVSCAQKLLELHATSESEGLFPYVHSYSMDQHLFSVLLIQVIDVMAEQDEVRAQIRMEGNFQDMYKT
ncbi:conserved hypothetical protein [Talaromyces stipitatus ATCC 10500]|uniref:Transcription factor domain-containing protein n=1 Tax=Talaromyces stipitatus (strain ATCC 10500 / CBS 375.48 / QM 6759 / NRRL 1006) TaxID=441959 RepID=B8M093_TALSN|nr:uncharacterized protein TSTA_084210 [Talaromyces stipitatus ATCC 10500]EED21190.1 conserved hypothetical protein [Talaromyces stipitatus ATCC 10500]